MSSILIVDDHAILRQGLAAMISKAFSDVVIGEAGLAATALDLLQQRKWDLLLLDIGLPDRSGLDLIQDANRLQPGLPVLVLTGLPDDAAAVLVFEVGAKGYLNKACTKRELIDAVGKLLAGGRYLSNTIAEKLAATLSQRGGRSSRDLLANVKGRMFEVLLLLGRGNPVKAIAADMGVSVKTVSTYRLRLMERLALKSNADIVRYCISHGLVQ